MVATPLLDKEHQWSRRSRRHYVLRVLVLCVLVISILELHQSITMISNPTSQRGLELATDATSAAAADNNEVEEVQYTLTPPPLNISAAAAAAVDNNETEEDHYALTPPPLNISAAAATAADNNETEEVQYTLTPPPLNISAAAAAAAADNNETEEDHFALMPLLNISAATAAAENNEMEEAQYTLTPPPLNIHKNYTLESCAEHSSSSNWTCPIHPVSAPLFEMIYGYKKRKRNGMGHGTYTGPMMVGIQKLAQVQSFMYSVLQKWWELSQEYDIPRWAAHGGTAMAAVCHHSINPWDDDIDITASSCEGLERIFANAEPNISAFYPKMKQSQYRCCGGRWQGRLVDHDWILLKGSPYYKLKSVRQIETIPSRDLGGIDIMCMDSGITRSEKRPMQSSGFEDYLKGNEDLQIVEFGPTHIQLVSSKVIDKYVLDRYGRRSFCDFPMTKHRQNDELPPKLPPRASQLEFALSKWYTSKSQREEWCQQVDQADGNEITKQVPNLDEIEIDNTIAPMEACQVGSGNRTLKVIGFNAERGTYWAQFAEMLRTSPSLEQPDLIILNKMDIGMARSGNIHTTRKLAFDVGMNYAWGLEFVELTNGNQEEQNATVGIKNTLGLHGNAILSKCKLYDPILVRDSLSPKHFTAKKFKENAMGMEKRLGGHMAMFVRMETKDPLQRHLVVGSIHKTNPDKHAKQLQEYFGFDAHPPNPEDMVTRPKDQLGVVTSGDMADRKFCRTSGLLNLDKPQKHKTFPALCSEKRLGNWRGDHFCGNLPIHSEDEVILPCFNSSQAGSQNKTLQLSDHSITKIELDIPS